MSKRNSTAPAPNTLISMYRESTKRYADRMLFGSKRNGNWQWLSYREFGRQTDELRGGLAALGVMRGDVVAIQGRNGPRWASILYAALGLGAVVVPLPLHQPANDRSAILKDSDAKILFFGPHTPSDELTHLLDTLPTLEHAICLEENESEWTFNGLRAQGRETPKLSSQAQPDETALLMYTAGNRREPRGARITHQNLMTRIDAFCEVFPLEEGDRAFSLLPWTVGFGQLVELHVVLHLGASLAFADAAASLFDQFEEVRPTILCIDPRSFAQMRDELMDELHKEDAVSQFLTRQALDSAEQQDQLNGSFIQRSWKTLKFAALDNFVLSRIRTRFGEHLRFIISGGAPLSLGLRQFAARLGITIHECYGLTEAGLVTANYPDAITPGSAGKPMPGVTVNIENASGVSSTLGEILVHSPAMMDGYQQSDADPTAPNDSTLLHTGDLGYLDSDGNLYVIGPLHERYALANGKLVDPRRCEEVLETSPFISQAFLYGPERPFTVALIVIDEDALRRWAKAWNIDPNDPTSEDAIFAMIRGEVDIYSGEFRQFEKVNHFHILHEKFTPQEGLLTANRRNRRDAIAAKYNDILESLYDVPTP